MGFKKKKIIHGLDENVPLRATFIGVWFTPVKHA
jgi:hypothetical protein